MFYKLFKFKLSLWSCEEIIKYTPIKSSRLEAFYASADLNINRPVERFYYLVENFIGLDWDCRKMIKKKADEEGNAAALNLLETMVDTFDLYD